MSNDFEPGDWALHKNNQLDAREVARVGTAEDGTRVITLDIFGTETDPVPAANYINQGRRA